MQQLWYTWTDVGYGVATGFRVRAASAGLTDQSSERFRAIGAHLGYALPQITEAYTLPAEQTALCLAFLDTGKEQILVNKRHAALDHARRPFHFSHVLADLPGHFSAREAIERWRSPFWKYSPEGWPASSLDLPLAAEREVAAGPLNERAVVQASEYLPFVIQAFLFLQERRHQFPQERRQLFVAAHPDTVAALLWGLTHALPRPLLRGLTFSTYERDVSRSTASIVGACWSSDPQARAQDDLPASCYLGTGLAMNCFSGKRSQLEDNPLAASFANFATESFVSGRQKALYELCKEAEAFHLVEVHPFLQFSRYFTSNQLAREEIQGTLRDRLLAPVLLKHEPFQQQLFALIIADRRWWLDSGQQLLQSLRDQADAPNEGALATALAELGKAVSSEVERGLKDLDEQSARFLLECLMLVDPASKVPIVWLTLLSNLTASSTFPRSRDVRDRLLTGWNSVKTQVDLALIRPWVEVPWGEECEHLFSLQLPDAWYQITVARLLELPSSPFAARVVDNYPAIFSKALGSLVRDPTRSAAAKGFFVQMVQAGCRSKRWLLYGMLGSRESDAALVSELILQAKLTEEETVWLLESRPYPDILDAILELFTKDQAWRMTQGKPALQSWRQRAINGEAGTRILETFAQRVADKAREELKQHSRARANPLLNLLLLIAPMSSAIAPEAWQIQVWRLLLNNLAKDADGAPVRLYDRTLREWLLKACGRELCSDMEVLHPWLAVPWEEVEPLFGLGLPAELELLALTQALSAAVETKPIDELMKVAMQRPTLFQAALRELLHQPKQRGLAMTVSIKLLKANYAEKQNLLYTLLDEPGLDVQQKEETLQAACLTRQEAKMLLEQHSHLLLASTELPPAFFRMAQEYLRHLFADGQSISAENRSVIARLYDRAKEDASGELAALFATQATRAADQAFAALKKVNDAAAQFWLEFLIITAVPRFNARVWLDLLRRLNLHCLQGDNPVKISWKVRELLLQPLGIIAKEQDILGELRLWLAVSWEELEWLFGLNLPPALEQEALKQALSREGRQSVIELIRIEKKRPSLFENALRELLQQPQTAQRVTRVFGDLALQGYLRRLSLFYALLETPNLDANRADELLRGARLTSQEAQSFLEEHSQRWLMVSPPLPRLIELLENYLAAFTLSDLARASALQLVGAIHELGRQSNCPLPARLCELAAAWNIIGRFREEPSADKAPLDALKWSVPHLPSQLRPSIIQCLLPLLAYQIRDADSLERVIVSLSPVLPEEPEDFFRHLAGLAKQQYRQDGILAWFIPYIVFLIRETLSMKEAEHEAAIYEYLDPLVGDLEGKVLNELTHYVSAQAGPILAIWERYVRGMRSPSRAIKKLFVKNPFHRESND